jgi:hypothetical protein
MPTFRDAQGNVIASNEPVDHASAEEHARSSAGAPATGAPQPSAATQTKNAAPTTPTSASGTSSDPPTRSRAPLGTPKTTEPDKKGSPSLAGTSGSTPPSSSSPRRASASKPSNRISHEEDRQRQAENQKWLTDDWNKQRGRIGELEHELRRQRQQIEELRATVGNLDTAPIRAAAVRELAALLPLALKRARQPKGSPALLRLILRSLKSL